MVVILRCTIVEPAVDLSDLRHPLFTIPMLHLKDSVRIPVKVIGDIGYLLVQAI